MVSSLAICLVKLNFLLVCGSRLQMHENESQRIKPNESDEVVRSWTHGNYSLESISR